jgi:hypothetical protein
VGKAVTLSIIVATSGRGSLSRTLASLASQIGDGDEILVLRRDNVPKGNATRDEAIKKATGSHLWWADDDDIAAPGALETIRKKVAEDPQTIHIFKMKSGAGYMLWEEPEFRLCGVGGPMCVVPNIPGKLGKWKHKKNYTGAVGACGDYHFLAGTLKKLGTKPVFHKEIIALTKPHLSVAWEVRERALASAGARCEEWLTFWARSDEEAERDRRVAQSARPRRSSDNHLLQPSRLRA